LWHGDESAGVPAMPGAWNDDTRFKVIRSWLAKKHNGFCNHNPQEENLLPVLQSEDPRRVFEPALSEAESGDKPQELVLWRLTPRAEKLFGATANNSTASES